MPSTDPDFIRYATTGDGDAFRALVSAHLGMVIAVAVRRLGPHAHLAPDVAQGVFTRLARVARGLPRDLIVAPWLHRQAVRLAIDAVRKEERRLRRETTAAMLYAPDSTPPPAETALLVDEALDQLPAADRTVLVLRYLEDRDFESVAQSLGSTPEAARKRIARSLEKLRALLTRRGTALSLTALTAFLTDQSAPAAPAALTARISASALQSAATGNTAAILTTALLSHAAALTTGALAALLACGLFYQQREKEIAPSAAGRATESAGVSDRSVVSAAQSATAPLPTSLEDIIAELVKITDGPDTSTARERITALLRRVPPKDYRGLYRGAEPQIHRQRWIEVIYQSVDLWQKTDAAALTVALYESDIGKANRILPGQRPNFLNSISLRGSQELVVSITRSFYSWAQSDNDGARRWLTSIPDSPLMRTIVIGKSLRDTLCEHLLRAWIQYAPVATMPDWLDAGDQLLCEQVWAEHLASTAPTELFPRNATTRLVELVATNTAHDHSDVCQQWIQNAGADDRSYHVALGVLRQPQRKIEGGSEWVPDTERLLRAEAVLNAAGVRPREEVLSEIAKAWRGGNNDHALIEWLLRQGASNVIAELARLEAADSSSNKAEALNWAAAIPDAAQRGPLLRGLYLRWQDADPAAAQKFLTTAPADIASELHALTPEAP